MALPQHVLSSSPIASSFLTPRNRFKDPLEDWDEGGVAIQNPSLGLRVYEWRCRVIGDDVVLDVPDLVAPTTIYSASGITEIGFTFDQNMQPVIVFMVGALCKYRWFNPTVPGFEVITLPFGCYAPRCMLDDKRPAQVPVSDVLITYLRDGSLYYREQRDRFLIEYTLDGAIDVSKTIGQFGMNTRMRMQWQLVSTIPFNTPTLTSISPTFKVIGAATFTLTINGTNFVPESVAFLESLALATTYVSSTQVTATVDATELDTVGVFDVTVVNPFPGGGESNAESFSVRYAAPTTTSISPTSRDEDDTGFTLTINGTNFYPASVATFDGNDRVTTYVSSTQVTAAILAADIVDPGDVDVTVTNPSTGGGGGTSNAQTFTITDLNPVPVLTSIDETPRVEDLGAFTLTCTGTDFIPTSVVRWDGADRTTTYISSTSITAAILSTDVDDAGTFNVTVFNPTPGGGTSSAKVFTVTATPLADTPTILDITSYASSAPSSSHAVTMPGTIVAGDLLILLIASGNDSVSSVTGWTSLLIDSAFASNLAVRYKVAAGGDTATVALTGSEQLATKVIRVQKDTYAASSFIEEAHATFTLNPPNLTPSWGSAKNLWLAVIGTVGTTGTIVVGYPLSDNNEKTQTGTSGGGVISAVAVCTENSTASSKDPSAFTLTNATNFGPVATIAVKPH